MNFHLGNLNSVLKNKLQSIYQSIAIEKMDKSTANLASTTSLAATDDMKLAEKDDRIKDASDDDMELGRKGVKFDCVRLRNKEKEQLARDEEERKHRELLANRLKQAEMTGTNVVCCVDCMP